MDLGDITQLASSRRLSSSLGGVVTLADSSNGVPLPIATCRRSRPNAFALEDEHHAVRQEVAEIRSAGSSLSVPCYAIALKRDRLVRSNVPIAITPL
jgi:hypothetical protein